MNYLVRYWDEKMGEAIIISANSPSEAATQFLGSPQHQSDYYFNVDNDYTCRVVVIPLNEPIDINVKLIMSYEWSVSQTPT